MLGHAKEASDLDDAWDDLVERSDEVGERLAVFRVFVLGVRLDDEQEQPA